MVTKNYGDNINRPINAAIPSDIAIGTDAAKQISKIIRTRVPILDPSLLLHWVFGIYIFYKCF